MRVGVLDYGCGNIPSVLNMLEYIGVDAEVISTAKNILECESVILPGVGHFQHGVNSINASGIREALDARASSDKPILGICLGMQLMTSSSEEGGEGLGWFDCETKKFPEVSNAQKLRIPHMGWNYIEENPGTKFFSERDRFYFVHSYYVDAVQTGEELCSTNYGGVCFSSAIRKGNLIGVQFHPEKSHHYGMEFFKKYFNSLGIYNAS